MYARGMSMREIVGHPRELYGIEVSPDLISTVTDAVLEEVSVWQGRPLDAVYPLVFSHALRVNIRDEGLVRNKAVHSCVGRARRRRQGSPRSLDQAKRGRHILAAGHIRTAASRKFCWPSGRPPLSDPV